jgi:hypothetical protein
MSEPHDVVIISDGPDGHVWHCYTCDVAGWYDAGEDTGAHDPEAPYAPVDVRPYAPTGTTNGARIPYGLR